MNHKYFKSVVGGMLTLISASAFATDGRLNFTGEILETACELAPDTGHVYEVQLGTWTKETFYRFDDRSTPLVEINIPMKNCPGSNEGEPSKFHVVLTATPDEINSEFIKVPPVEGTPGNRGFGISLMDSEKNPIPVNGQSNKEYTIVGPEMNLVLYASYKLVNDSIAQANVVAGPANATADVTLNYQ
ncbi:fimbrial protein [Dryocola sp. BD626]|uniref:fimbrial protein n=1 Tax=Dryocola sp. BD626 TaxID=3133273 RepID=UPI003F4FCC23